MSGKARVAPIYKEGSSDHRLNYRPISILPVISRLFEKLIYNQLCNYLIDTSFYTSINLASRLFALLLHAYYPALMSDILT